MTETLANFALGVLLWVIFVCSGFVVVEMLREWRLRKRRK